ncbi:hypothetical protein CIK05_14620 [Bdellovibrio sp. qaytius]|nr:hypothetical protein CIK05_14620 [Bdellovibrio sp. qaytius]
MNSIKSLLIILSLTVSAMAHAQVTDTAQPVIAGVFAEVKEAIPLFSEDSDLRVELVADFDKLLTLPEKDTNTKVPAKLIYFTDGASHELEVRLSTRGDSKQMFCKNFRPLRIFFDPKLTDLSQTLFKGISEDLKLATHCDGLGKIADSNPQVQQILREQTAYKMVAALGFLTLKTRSAIITYKNLDGSIKAEARAFFLEPKSNMAKRYGLKHLRKGKADVIFAPEPENKIAFEFTKRFLMHTDVDFGGNHNTILVIREGEQKASAMLPYDFDLVGVVIGLQYQGAAYSYKPWTQAGWGDDGAWFKEFVGGKYLSKEYIDQAYTVATYALNHKEDVQRVIDASPAVDKSLMQARVNAFFSGIERAVNER